MDIEDGITKEEIAERLKVSQSYITMHILKSVKRIDNNSYHPIFDLDDLREHLVSQSTFTRQTKRINIKKEIQMYMLENPNATRPDINEFLGDVPDLMEFVSKRKKIPSIPLAPSDFWDINLIFPKNYKRDGVRVADELCYRDMFKAGAIKIKLGNQKTMFYIPGDRSPQELLATPIDDPKCFLVPADWKPFYKGVELQENSVLKKQESAIDSNERYFLLGVIAEREKTAYSLFYMGLELSQVAQATTLPKETVVEMWNTYKKNRKQIIDEYGLDNKRDGKSR